MLRPTWVFDLDNTLHDARPQILPHIDRSMTRYVEAVIALLGIGHLFDAVYSIESVRFRSKPSAAGFRAVLAAERVDPRACIMVEDSLANLRTAKRIGMRTVWVACESRSPAYVDLRVGALAALPRLLGALRKKRS